MDSCYKEKRCRYWLYTKNKSRNRFCALFDKDLPIDDLFVDASTNFESVLGMSYCSKKTNKLTNDCIAICIIVVFRFLP